MSINASTLPTPDAYTPDGHASMVPAVPDDVISPFMTILSRCTLPSPFLPGISLLVNRWSPHLMADVGLPMITWKVIHTCLNEQMALRERYTHSGKMGPSGFLQYRQQNFDHIVQFECYAGTEEEVSRLEWWLIRQTYLYRYMLAMAGAQAWRFLEAREDFLVPVSMDKWPARAVRFAFTTAMLFPEARSPLLHVDVDVCAKLCTPLEATATITRGDDILSFPSCIDTLLAVTSMDGVIPYAPMYDAIQGQFVWTPDQQQPALGSQYLVHYLQYGSETFGVSMPIPVLPR